MCVALPGRYYSLPTCVGIPTSYLVATTTSLVVCVSRLAWLLSARDHDAVPNVLSGGDVAPAYVGERTPGCGWVFDTWFLGSGSTPSDAG